MPMPWRLALPRAVLSRQAAFRRVVVVPRQRRNNEGIRHQHTGPDRGRGLGRILRISEEVADAVATRRPVVALESTIYTHGAIQSSELQLEEIVRSHGAVPAVCGVLAGVPTVGLTPAEVQRMVDEGAEKVSRRDLAFLVGRGMLYGGGGQTTTLHGGTTIAGTMILARQAGIRVFGTGGLGGVHRGGEDSMDVSADLTELGRTRVAVISSGCKGFLDIPRTLEVLETQGVLVATFADDPDVDDANVTFPAFWARDSQCRSPAVVRTEREAAAAILAQERLGVESGLLFANPIPREHAIPRAEMDAAIAAAVREADALGYAGSRNTPFILRRIRELTDGRSVPANVALVRANVARAAAVAVELADLEAADLGKDIPSYTVQVPPLKQPVREVEKASKQRNDHQNKADILVAGSVALDLSCDFFGGAAGQVAPTMHTSNPCAINQSVGGVGHNVALAAHRAAKDLKVQLCSMVGQDAAGQTVLDALRTSGLDASSVRRLGTGARTARYVAVNDADKNLVVAMADMDIFTSTVPTTTPTTTPPTTTTPDWAASALAAAQPSWVVVDANWSPRDIRAWMHAARAHNARVAFEPVSTAKAARLFAPHPPSELPPLDIFPHATLDLLSPNEAELAALHAAATENGGYLSADPRWFATIDALGITASSNVRARFDRILSSSRGGSDRSGLVDRGVPQQCLRLLPYAPTLTVKLGPAGVLLAILLRAEDPRLHEPEAQPFLVARAPPGAANGVGGVYMRLFPPPSLLSGSGNVLDSGSGSGGDIVSVNGAGDTFLGVLVAGLARGGRVDRLVDVAQRGAALTLRSRAAVSEELGTLGGELLDASGVAERG